MDDVGSRSNCAPRIEVGVLLVKKLLFRATLGIVAVLAIAGPVLANTEFYSWTMNYRIVNNGGGPLHHMNAGDLTNRGQIWAYSKDSGATSSPYQVTIDVYKEGGWPSDELVCRVRVTPYTTLNLSKQYTNTACGAIPSADYYITIWKTNDDGWNEKGQGDLITN